MILLNVIELKTSIVYVHTITGFDEFLWTYVDFIRFLKALRELKSILELKNG